MIKIYLNYTQISLVNKFNLDSQASVHISHNRFDLFRVVHEERVQQPAHQSNHHFLVAQLAQTIALVDEAAQYQIGITEKH